ncbi:hypothetical protein [Brevibacterium luteolum]|uniref:hypothetical protein n=1 Tax=Brevibacterium luteolum TaxID=199591 RepID=UPI001404B27F|nr:hypothetical protein [Brevibacterium luteolum]
MVVVFRALRYVKRGYRLADAATVLGFMATGFFPLTGGIQILLLPILPDALTVV